MFKYEYINTYIYMFILMYICIDIIFSFISFGFDSLFAIYYIRVFYWFLFRVVLI